MYRRPAYYEDPIRLFVFTIRYRHVGADKGRGTLCLLKRLGWGSRAQAQAPPGRWPDLGPRSKSV